MKQIPLTKGLFALVDDIDFEWLNQWKWHADYSKNTDSFYARRTDRSTKNKKSIRMSRVILNAKPHELIDHKNHNTLDNQRNNIRIVTYSQNNCNQKIQKRKKLSIYKGVCYKTNGRGIKKWFAYIQINNKKTHLGYFYTEIEAAKSYNRAAKKYYSDYYYLNPV